MNPTTTNLWHGYSLETINHLTTTAAHRATGRYALDPGDTYETAWGAIVEHLATSTEPPTPRDLLTIAYQAINTAANRARSHNGTARTWGADEAATANFVRYWELAARATTSPEDAVVDQCSMVQIWPMLTARQQQTLWALALHDGNHQDAARTLGCALSTFRDRLSDARAEYRGWWHQGEKPSAMWGRSGQHGRRTATQTLVDRRQQRARRAAATA